MLSLLGTMASAGGGTLAAAVITAKVGAATGTAVAPGLGTAIGVAGGLAGGFLGGTAVKALGDVIREDDSIILSRMFNAAVLSMVYEYLFNEAELNAVIEKLNGIRTREFKKLFAAVHASENQEKVINDFIRHYFEEVIRRRPQIEAPTMDDIIETISEFEVATDNSQNTEDG
jgi:hypothetical protein